MLLISVSKTNVQVKSTSRLCWQLISRINKPGVKQNLVKESAADRPRALATGTVCKWYAIFDLRNIYISEAQSHLGNFWLKRQHLTQQTTNQNGKK